MDAHALEALLRRTNPTIEAERAALAAGRWAEYLAERVPPPSWLHPVLRGAWKEARERALALGARTETREAVVFPAWYCSNEDDVPGSDWQPAVVVSFEDGSFELHERKTIPAIVLATIEQAHLGFLVRSRDYAPDIALPFRNAHYGAIGSRRIERVREITRRFDGAELPRPERDLPPFATDAAPARTAPDELAPRIDAALARLRVFPEGAEPLVAPPRPRR